MSVTGTEAAIYEALVWFVSQIVIDPVLKRSEPNVAFTPVVKTPYLSVSVMPNTAELDGLPFDSDVTHMGLLQVSVFWPANTGLVKPMQVASQIVAAFPPGLWIERNGITVRFDQQPRVAGSIQESDWVSIPVTMRWRACAA